MTSIVDLVMCFCVCSDRGDTYAGGLPKTVCTS